MQNPPFVNITEINPEEHADKIEKIKPEGIILNKR